MKNIKNQKGITLVTLVITIIILIILAGVSINAVIGENGIITIAKKAKENVELAQIEEENMLNELYTQLDAEGELIEGTPGYNAILRLNEFKKKIADYIYEATNEQIDLTNKNVEPNYQTASAETFGQAIKQIVVKVTALDEDKAATATDITEGKEAWVNGNKIIGTNLGNSVSTFTTNISASNATSRNTGNWASNFTVTEDSEKGILIVVGSSGNNASGASAGAFTITCNNADTTFEMLDYQSKYAYCSNGTGYSNAHYLGVYLVKNIKKDTIITASNVGVYSRATSLILLNYN